ncbi:glycosyltransferase [Asticcacaulis biprosthecium]|uniref:glycosyltransferase n=1 Tax=Asticcacaulis biprosthecium TaxID=76891 RepID=UPI0035ABE0F0
MVGLMRDCDWIVMPSVWWENAPVVLQEARLSGVPALVSNVGGMAEKVGKGVHGEHFVVANPGSLASRLNAIINGDIQVTVPEFDLDAYNRGIMDNLTGIYGATA